MEKTDEEFDLAAAFAAVAASPNKVSVLGSMMVDNVVSVDHLPQPGETLASGPVQLFGGGKSGNQAAAAARIGAQVQLFGAVGSDAGADLLIRLLQEAGVDTSNLKHTAGASGSTFIAVDRAGENWVLTQAAANAEVDVDYLNTVASTLVEGTVLGLCLEIPLATDVAAAQLAQAAGLSVWLNNSPFTADIPAALRQACDGLIVNEHEMAQMLGLELPADGNWDGFDWSTVATAFRDYGFDQALVTLGAEGSVVLDRGTVSRIQPVRVRTVDTTGCGDSFFAAVLAGLAAGLPLAAAAHLASAVSAYAAAGMGAQASYGSAEQILGLVRG